MGKVVDEGREPRIEVGPTEESSNDLVRESLSSEALGESDPYHHVSLRGVRGVTPSRGWDIIRAS